ncbi:MAG: hypothetical protein IKZ28_01460, partial [Clostridia bacterium]|nr:hypothetical protein [Clostridia bacterium]
MKTIFKKKHLPLIKGAVHNRGNAEEQYKLYYKMRLEDGLDRQYASERILLERGAYAGDVRSMVELARSYYFGGGLHGL